MPHIRLPSNHDTSYPPPRGPALLLSCMDLRLMDDIIQLMDHDGLANRYDHVILAGAALGALGIPGAAKDYSHWKKVFEDHLEAACNHHHIKDIYIVEHRDCGAYREYIGKDFDDDQADEETACHREYAVCLEKEIKKWVTVANKGRADKDKIKLRVKSFLMDLRGVVSPLHPQSARTPKGSKRN